ncbi:hypothetical protein [Halorussus salinus]|uniref:hypothetical protein n=1 Tax=Halorussus salinus TaxID=1364935 RepID=UPI001091E8FF|nr:hypothetical protein [Halorussus salinus]
MPRRLRERWGFDRRQTAAFALLGAVLVGALVAGVSNADGPLGLARAVVIACSLPVVLAAHRLTHLFEDVTSQQEGAVMLVAGLVLLGGMTLFGDRPDDEFLLALGAYCLLGVAQLLRPYVRSLRDDER